MLINLLRKDTLRQKSIIFALLVFISLSACLVASGSTMIAELSRSLNALFAKADAPHFVQMHAGTIDEADFDDFASGNPLVKKKQIAEMLLVDGSNITIGSGAATEKTSVMDHYFVKQNRSFDLLLNLDNEPVRVSPGSIAVPVYYMQRKNLNVGDKVALAGASFRMDLTVSDFVRDVQMNPSIVHSKRFVVHETDLDTLAKNLGETEYLIEFQLTDPGKLSEFRQAYESSGLPGKGPNVDDRLFKMLHAITDGMVAAVIILVSLLLNIIALLCIRFTILAVVEEDYREIGVMKAIGIGQRDIKKMYLLKYVALAAFGCAIGYAASLFLKPLFTSNMMLYLGTAPGSFLPQLIPFVAAAVIFFIIVSFCRFILRKFDRISAVEALRSGNVGESRIHAAFLPLHRTKRVHVPLFLGIRDVLQRFKMYRLLLFIFCICSFMAIVPLHFLNTVQSPDFIKYMGIERSDLRIDMQQADIGAFHSIVDYIKNDPDIERFSPKVTSRFEVVREDGIRENMTVETGDFSMFPLEYVQGGPPLRDEEIALSYLNGKELGKQVGDRLRLVVHGQEKEAVVSGIYQDVTHGGRTAKAIWPFRPETALRYEVSLDVKPHIDVGAKTDEYAKAFYPARVTDLKGYLTQTFGGTIRQLKLFTMIAFAVALFVAILITSLFLRMVLAKDETQIAIMRSIGFSFNHIRTQYLARTLLPLGIGIILGTVVANTLGERMAGALMSFMGAARIEFAIDPVQAYLVCPLIFTLVVAIAALLSLLSIEKTSIARIIAN